MRGSRRGKERVVVRAAAPVVTAREVAARVEARRNSVATWKVMTVMETTGVMTMKRTPQKSMVTKR